MEIHQLAASNPAAVTGGISPIPSIDSSSAPQPAFDTYLSKLTATPVPGETGAAQSAALEAQPSVTDSTTSSNTTGSGTTSSSTTSASSVPWLATAPTNAVIQNLQQIAQAGLVPNGIYAPSDFAPGAYDPSQMAALGFTYMQSPSGGAPVWVGPSMLGSALLGGYAPFPQTN